MSVMSPIRDLALAGSCERGEFPLHAQGNGIDITDFTDSSDVDGKNKTNAEGGMTASNGTARGTSTTYNKTGPVTDGDFHVVVTTGSRHVRCPSAYVDSLDAQRYAEICGSCGFPIPSGAPVALQQRDYRSGRARRVTCCLSCAERWLVQQCPPLESCPHCRRPVYRRRPQGRLFCCDRCAWLAASARRRARTAERREKVCAVCGHAFTAKRADARTCSPACRQRDHRRRLCGRKPDELIRPTAGPRQEERL